MRIEQIQMHNFKGIADMTVSLSGASAIILGGKNGYGKTTIFDALELVFTGEIERYRNYEKNFFDHRRNPNKIELANQMKLCNTMPAILVAPSIG